MGSSISPALQLADDYLAHRREHDHAMALYKGDLTHIERWPEVTDEVVDARSGELDSFIDRAADTPAKSRADQNLVDTVGHMARYTRAQGRYGRTLRWINPEVGMVGMILTFLPRYPLIDADHGERYHDKIRAFPTFIDTWCDVLERAAIDRTTPIAHLVRAQIEQLDRVLSSPLSSGPLGRQPAPIEFDAATSDTWTSVTNSLLDDEFASALGHLRSTLVDHTLPAAMPDDRPGLLHLDGGDAAYAHLLAGSTSTDQPAEAIHAIGRAQVARLDDEYRSIAGPLLDTTDLSEIYRRLRDDTSLHYSEGDTLTADATAALQRATAAAADWFGALPTAPCTANAVEVGGLAFYSPPARDGSKPGRFFFNTSDPSAWGTYQLEAVTFHEGIPGHHLQLALAQELPDLHPMLADYAVEAYAEGWGLYTERLADEMGLYSSELDRVGMLSADSMRACRLVVDTGLHALGWTRQQAIDYMIDNSPSSVAEVEAEVDRYIGMPGQACSYMIGRLAIDEIRANAESTLGDRFEIAAFHDQVLAAGSISLDALRATIEEWADGIAA